MADNAVGVPDIVPVVVSNDKPAGNDGLTSQLTTGPPVLAGLHVAIAALIT